jgi:integrase
MYPILQLFTKWAMKSKITLLNTGKYSYLYIYYTVNHQTLRINTKLRTKDSDLTRQGFFKKRILRSDENNKLIADIKNQVDLYIKQQSRVRKPIKQAECGSLVEKYIKERKVTPVEKIQPVNSSANKFLSHYDRFLRERQQELNISTGTVIVYTNLKNTLIDFEKFIHKPLTLLYFTEKSNLIEFKAFLVSERSLDDNTVAKRLTTLRTYFRWIEENNLCSYSRSVYSVKQSKYQKEIIALSREELLQLLNLKPEKPSWERIVDVFCCNCFMGLRASDFFTMNLGEFKKDSDGDYFYIKENIKTGITVCIPISSIPLKILQKYSFNLPVYSSQYFNRELQKILKHFKLFTYPVVHIRKVQKENRNKTFLMNDLITSHTCRKTFITLAVSNNIPLNAIMKASGHTKVNTLSSYIQAVTNKKEFDKLSII